MYVTFIGILGALIILLCFVANEFNKIDRHPFVYDIGNVIGSLLLSGYAYLLGSWPFLVLNVIWAVVALRDLIYQKRKTQK